MKKSLLSLLAIAGILSVNAQTSLYSENFESTTGVALPAGWTQTTNASDGGWRTANPTTNYSATAGISSSYFTVPALTGSTRSLGTNDDGCNCDKSADVIVSPVINCSGQPTVFLAFDLYYYEATYQSYSEILTLRVSSNGGTTWTNIGPLTGAGGWNNVVFDISSVAANQSNVKVSLVYDDGGAGNAAAWLYGAVIDNFNVYAPAQRDMAALTLDMYAYTANNTPNTLAGTMKNLGGAAVTTMDLNYKVDNGTVVTQSLTGLNIAPLSTYNYTHGTAWTPTTTGNHTVKLWASNINGGADAVNANDTVMFTTYTCSQVDQRVMLYEGFSSSTCGPCAAANPALHTLLVNNNVNTAGSKVAAVKYQMDYPAPGNDPAYTAECDTRHTFYGVQGIPEGVIDGGLAYQGHPAGLDQSVIDAATATPAPIKVSATATYNGTTVTVSGSVSAYANISGNNKVLVAIVEDQINSTDGGHGTQSNGETAWYEVMRKMAGGTSGTNIGNMTDGSNYPFNVSANFTGYTGSGTGTPKIFTNINQMTAVVWVQDLTSKVVYQAGFADVVTSVNDIESPLSTFDMYPNPSIDNTNIKFTLKNSNSVQVKVYNMMGQVVYAQNYGTMPAGVNQIALSSVDFASGMYNVVLTAGEYNTTAKLNIQK
jgi:hypothetical protein